MQSGDVSLAGVHFQHLVNNTMLPFINPATQLVDWSGHQNVTGNQCYRKYVFQQAFNQFRVGFSARTLFAAGRIALV